jgi:hypothetical protein
MAINSYLMKNGIGYKIDTQKSKEMCLESCSKGSKLGEVLRLLFGFDTQMDHKKAFQIISERCEEDTEFKRIETPYFLFFLARSQKILKFLFKF